MPLNSRGQRVKTHNQSKQKAQANVLRKKKSPTGANEGGVIGGGTASAGGGS